MGILTVEKAVTALTAAGLRAAAAYPGTKMPYLSGPAVTVGLEKVENGADTLRAEVLSPAYLDGSACGEYAESARTALEALGAECVQGPVQYNGQTDLFSIEITAFFPAAEEKPDLTVQVGSAVLANAVEFTAEQETEDPAATPLSECVWNFRIREAFSPGDGETSAPTEPFDMTVKRTGMTEYFTGCYFTACKRVDAMGGLEQTRTGTAASRSVVAVV